MIGYQYRSSASIGGWPLVPVCAGVDPLAMRPRIAKGIVAIGNISVGAVAVGGVALGLVTVGGGSLGLLFAPGGAAIRFIYAVGGGAFGPAIVDGTGCDEAAREFILRWMGPGVLPPHCPVTC